MTLSQITSPRFRRIVENTFLADSRLDPDAFLTGLTPDASFILGGLPPAEGHAAIRAFLVQTFQATAAIQHSLRRVFEGTDVLAYEATVTTTLKDGRVIVSDYANVLEFQGDLVRRYQIYIDLSPLRPR